MRSKPKTNVRMGHQCPKTANDHDVISSQGVRKCKVKAFGMLGAKCTQNLWKELDSLTCDQIMSMREATLLLRRICPIEHPLRNSVNVCYKFADVIEKLALHSMTIQ